MRLVLEKRPERSAGMALLSPIIALTLTVIAGGMIFALRGLDPFEALYIYFVEPLTQDWAREQLIVKATPLVLIGAGLAVSYSANVWNIGAEGQFVIGALLAGMIPVFFTGWQTPEVMVVMLALGVIGGMAWAAIPAFLKTRFSANEILTSLMLVYVAQYIFDWLVRGPWRDPQGFNFPKTVNFDGWQLLPRWGEIHLGALFALIAAFALFLMMSRMLRGFELKVQGAAPRAGRFAGFSGAGAVMFCFLLSGALAGLAGACDVMGLSGQLQTPYAPNYGFVAIIVAFLGRLNPLGAIVAGLLLALSFMGGENVQVVLGISDKIAKVFQGILLFFLLACDTLILYRVRFESTRQPAARTAG
ncbi:ABC transporter permease [Aestuariivirga sp.]|jgi:simple sugar transport system permease protein|uniref:ABC transporter permease n=1 Tax=Aestuariivirga sp. TaxID=2650926 RepID=UPI003784B6A5